MDFKKCSRCGSFYVSNGNVCPKCSPKDNLEFSTFNSYINEHGLDESIDTISGNTGISVKNLNRFIEYNKLKQNGNVNLNKKNNNNGITFLI